MEFKIKGLALGKAKCGEKIYVDELRNDSGTETGNAAATIIQSFSKSADGELDLSNFNDSDADVSALTVGAIDSSSYSALKSAIEGISYDDKNIPANFDSMRQHVNESLPTLIDNEGLLALQTYSASENFIEFTKTSGDEECWDKTSVLFELSVHGEKTFKIKAVKWLGHLDSYTPTGTEPCEDTENYHCDGPDDLPPAKVLSSADFDKALYEERTETLSKDTFAVCGTVDDYWLSDSACDGDHLAALDKDYTVTGSSGLSFKASVSNDGISASFSENYLTVYPDEDSYDGTTVALKQKQVHCSYKADVKF